MVNAWLDVANETLIEAYRTEEFVEAQRKMLRSSSDYRLQERKIAESWCDAFHVPTRTEVDELQRTVVELRRQVRALQRLTYGKPASSPPRPATVTRSTAKVRKPVRKKGGAS
jgi:hypothetical protein